MSLVGAKSALVSQIHSLSEERGMQLAEIMRDQPRSYEEQEARSLYIGTIRRHYDEMIMQMMRRLRELCAVEERDGLWIQNPVEPRHVLEANQLLGWL